MTGYPTILGSLALATALAGCVHIAAGPAIAANAISGEWVVEDIGGRGVIDNSHATLVFGADGQLSGRATCNQMMSSYTADGHNLIIKPVALTRMVCAPALMNQERRLIDMLARVVRFQIDGTGALVLIAEDGDRVMARRSG